MWCSRRPRAIFSVFAWYIRHTICSNGVRLQKFYHAIELLSCLQHGIISQHSDESNPLRPKLHRQHGFVWTGNPYRSLFTVDLSTIRQQFTTECTARASENLPDIFFGHLFRNDNNKFCQDMYLQHRDRNYVLNVPERLCVRFWYSAMLD